MVDIVLTKMDTYRFYVYLGLFMLYNGYQAYREYRQRQKEKVDMELLQNSFSLDDGLSGLVAALGDDFSDGDDDSGKVVIDLKGNDVLRLAIDDYISERAK